MKIPGIQNRITNNILSSFLFRGASALCSFALVPVTLQYLDKSIYGVWLTILAFLNWTNVFDLGINNGLRTKLIYAFSRKDEVLARREVSTTYNIMLFFIVAMSVVVMSTAPFINWGNIFSTPGIANLPTIITASLLLFLFRLYIDLIYAILLADHRTGTVNFFYFLINAVCLGAVYVLSHLNFTDKLLVISIVLSIIPVLVGLLASVGLFLKRYQDIRPQFLVVHSDLIKPTLSQGMRFFIIQLSILIIFSTDNIIIINIFSPSDVTTYSICYKFFSIFTLGWTIIITPYWSAFGDAYYRQDIAWIRSRISLLVKLWWALNILLIITLTFINPIYKFWVGMEVVVPYSLSVFTALFISIFSLANIYVYFINGIGKMKVMLIISVIAGLLNIPLAIALCKAFGLTGIMMATCICLSANPIVAYIQYRKLITDRATGVWAQ